VNFLARLQGANKQSRQHEHASTFPAIQYRTLAGVRAELASPKPPDYNHVEGEQLRIDTQLHEDMGIFRSLLNQRLSAFNRDLKLW
jgi:hypothetical protein